MKRKNRPSRKEQRRKAAEANLAKWRKLTPEQQLKALDKGGYRAKKQRARIQSKIDAAKEKAKEKSKKKSTRKDKEKNSDRKEK
jgi:hypothetical protein